MARIVHAVWILEAAFAGMAVVRNVIGTAALIGALTMSNVTAAQTDDLGRFVVTQAIINPALDQRQTRFFDSDPLFIGRFVEISPRHLAIDGSSICRNVSRLRRRASIAMLLGAGLSSYNRRRLVQLSRHGIPTGSVATVRYECTNPANGQPGFDWDGAVGFPLQKGKRGLYWRNEIVLVLTPAVKMPKAGPSFSCTGKVNVSERTICRNPSLASWDRSVAAAYRLARDGGGPADPPATDDPAGLAHGQRKWIIERDRCGDDGACLEDRMAERVFGLMHGQTMFAPER